MVERTRGHHNEGKSHSTATPATATGPVAARHRERLRTALLHRCQGSEPRVLPRSSMHPDPALASGPVGLSRKVAALPAAGLTIRWAEELKTPSHSGVFHSAPAVTLRLAHRGFRRVCLQALFGDTQASSSRTDSWAMFHTCAIITGQKTSRVIAVGMACCPKIPTPASTVVPFATGSIFMFRPVLFLHDGLEGASLADAHLRPSRGDVVLVTS